MKYNLSYKEIIEKVLEQLELIVLNLETTKESLKSANEDYKYISDLVEVLNISSKAFVEGYISLSEKKKIEFMKILEKVISDEQRSNYILAQIINLYYLYDSGLINYSEVSKQVQEAEKTIQTLLDSLNQYLENTPFYKEEDKIKNIDKQIEQIISLGTKYEFSEDTFEIEDIDFFQQIIEYLDISEEEKLILITNALLGNVKIYEEMLSKDQANDLYLNLRKMYKQERKSSQPIEILEEETTNISSNQEKRTK